MCLQITSHLAKRWFLVLTGCVQEALGDADHRAVCAEVDVPWWEVVYGVHWRVCGASTDVAHLCYFNVLNS